MSEQFECSCGSLRKTLIASDTTAALKQFQALVAAKIYSDLVEGATTLKIRGPIRVRHATTECVFDRKSGGLNSARDLRPRRAR